MLVNFIFMDFAGLQLYPGKRTVTQIGFYSNLEGMQIASQLYIQGIWEICLQSNMDSRICEDNIQILNASVFGQNQQFPRVGADQMLLSPLATWFECKIDELQEGPS